MSPGLALAVTLAGGGITFVLAFVAVVLGDRREDRERRGREVETRRIVREELDR